MSDILGLDRDRGEHYVRKIEAHEALISTMTIQVQEIHDAIFLETFEKQSMISLVRDNKKAVEENMQAIRRVGRRRTPEWVEHAFKAATVAALSFFGFGGGK